MISFPVFMLQLPKRAFVVPRLQIVNHAVSNDALDELQHLRWFERAIRQQMDMIRHDHVSEQQKATRGPRFINGRTSNGLQRISSENRQAVFGDCGDEETWSIN
jgi:hypothetical protein